MMNYQSKPSVRKFDRWSIVLASNSPRRKQLLAGLDLDFEVKVLPGIDEGHPPNMPAHEIPQFVAREKAAAYLPSLADNELLITADTVVVAEGKILGKPADALQAQSMLRQLSGRTHQVITGVCLTNTKMQRCFADTTDVTFKILTDDEIAYYIEHYRPFDKAGAYGIQEWIGHIAVTALNGSYFNVMGLPVHHLYEELCIIDELLSEQREPAVWSSRDDTH